MRRAARVDSNQPEIVENLRKLGCEVLHLHQLGNGAPDICVGFGGRNYLFEIKDPRKTPSQRRLTPDELLFHNKWNVFGRVHIIETANQAFEIIKKDQDV